LDRHGFFGERKPSFASTSQSSCLGRVGLIPELDHETMSLKQQRSELHFMVRCLRQHSRIRSNFSRCRSCRTPEGPGVISRHLTLML
jgi:hypothetical protein